MDKVQLKVVMKKLIGTRGRLVLVLAMTGIAAGYFSNWITSPRCERATARWLVSGFQKEPRIYWRGELDPASLFPAGTVIVKLPERVPIYNRPSAPGVFVDLRNARRAIPFLVQVDWTREADPSTGSMGTCWYASGFGLYFKIRNQPL
jgi:hypothetical protein